MDLVTSFIISANNLLFHVLLGFDLEELLYIFSYKNLHQCCDLYYFMKISRSLRKFDIRTLIFLFFNKEIDNKLVFILCVKLLL